MTEHKKTSPLSVICWLINVGSSNYDSGLKPRGTKKCAADHSYLIEMIQKYQRAAIIPRETVACRKA
jgi:hypothetical protein